MRNSDGKGVRGACAAETEYAIYTLPLACLGGVWAAMGFGGLWLDRQVVSWIPVGPLHAARRHRKAGA